ncbi:MAG: hypothetical protein U0893_08740 [Chloroflexota bacterium]
MPSSTLDRPRTRAHRSDWVVLVQGQEPDDRSDAVALAAPAAASTLTHPRIGLPAPSTRMPALRPTLLPGAVGRLLSKAGLVAAAVALMGLLLGRDPLLALGLTAPQFVAYEAPTAEGVRFVMDDGWTQTAAVPGALLMDWRAGQDRPALRLTMGNPAAEPMVERTSADGKRIEAIRYGQLWPGIDGVIRGDLGGWACNMEVQPGVDPSTIEMEYVGATGLSIDAAGRLHIQSADGEWVDGTPESWQDGPSGREPVESHFELRGGNRFGFVVGPYDPSRPLVVDPPSERIR